MTNYFIIPGLGNSGTDHWQTHFENSGDNFTRIQQKEWEAPACSDWVSTIDVAIAAFDPSTVVLIGHSLACATIAHWAQQYKRPVKGALLVAPSDIEAVGYTFSATGFAPIPIDKINFNSIVVASEDDPWVTIERATYFADNWGSKFINIGKAGHINAAAGFGKWDDGFALLQQL